MRKLLIFIVLIFIAGLIVINPFDSKPEVENQVPTNEIVTENTVTNEEPLDNMPNPASKFCEESGGTVEIITAKDGSQFGMCKLEDYACEEWAYLKGECTIAEDAEKIKQALIAKGLNLTEMKVEIYQHLGKYIGGGVVPVSVPAGGGYVFAVKENDEIKIVADGNGVIMCDQLVNYPDYPSYLIPECVDQTGNSISR